MAKIIYPTIDLFLYDLKYSLGDTQKEIEQNQQNFLNKLPDYIDSSLFIENQHTLESEYVHLLKNTSLQMKPHNKQYEGYFYPVLLGDSYGLLIDCALNNKVDAQPTQCFAGIKAEIEPILKGQTANIGQTWMLSGWLPLTQTKSHEEIAQACYESFMPDFDWEEDLEGNGHFLGASIFELTHNNHHVIVIIYPDENTLLNISGKFYSDWMRLFYYRHKILWAYNQSRLVKNYLQNYFSTIKAGNDSLEQARNKDNELNKLNQILVNVQNTLNDYTKELTLLDFQGGTIDINLSNYEKRLGRIEQKANRIYPNSATDLAFFKEFIRLAQDKYRLQITKDTENLERGLKLLSDTINAVRSRVEVEKTERDRYFQNFVTLLAGGWAFGSFVAGLPGLGEKNDNPVRSTLIKFSNLKLSIPAKPNEQEPWWLMPATKGIYTLSGFIVAIVLLLIWRRFWRRYRSPVK
ncbi:hypothetical protein [Nostoc cycadae]|uniref:Uncharacterized protein n=1 Tax=Nostoc cycadae WK-1 TaxID=1861711 RepID=A0A2H6LIY8_9NOSO|nr:hypothetical protein [Nostoc cycadae]GBE93171.1 hypothetical protein NCWK1_2932 [Nostoc cycadae WK-1]